MIPFLAFVILSSAYTSRALVLLRVNVTQPASHSLTRNAFGVDFTVHSAIVVSAIGIVDADARGFNGSVFAGVVDRSTGRVVAGPVSVNSSNSRLDDTNLFVFRNITLTRLEPGVYTIVSQSAVGDGSFRTGAVPGSLVVGDTGNGSVECSGSVIGGDRLGPITTDLPSFDYFPTRLAAGATLVFEVAPPPPSPPLQTLFEFANCEAVACAGMPTGEYNLRGVRRFCDSDAAGGGWMRLWRVNDSTCEAQGWTSARNLNVAGLDPVGCRPAVDTCLRPRRIDSPFQFSEVRGGNWALWASGTPDGFNSNGVLPDGVNVRDSNDALVWALVVAQVTTNPRASMCPCDTGFTNSTMSAALLREAGTRWTCDRLPTAAVPQRTWTALFAKPACTGKSDAITPFDLLWFQQTLPVALQTLSVALCLDSPAPDEDIKLAAGELYVRKTAGFDKATACPARVTVPSPTSTAPLATIVGSRIVTGSTSSAPTTTTGTATTGTTTTGAAMTGTAALSTAPPETMQTIPGSPALIGGLVGGIGGLLLCLVVGCIVARSSVRQRQQAPAAASATPAQNQYSALPLDRQQHYGDVESVRRSAAASGGGAVYDSPTSVLMR